MSRYLKRYNPNHVLSDINRLFEQTFTPLDDRDDTTSVETSQWLPAVDVKEDAEQYRLQIDLPGVDKQDVNIAMHDQVLTIEGQRHEEKKQEKENYYRIERVSGKFYRRFTLPDTADGERISANLSKGVLEVKIPKKEQAQPKTIEIFEHD